MSSTAVDISIDEGGRTDFPYNYLPTRYRRAVRLRRSTPFRSARTAPADVRETFVLPTPAVDAGVPAGSHRATRLLNVLVGAIGLILSAPVFILIAVAVKLSSKGPVFYTQTRIGLDRRWDRKQFPYDIRSNDLGGRPFTMYKFRTMIQEAETDGQEIWATPRDPRVTLLGRFLRKSRLDELPQMINVLAGDMNIVGPRPERPGIFAELRESIPNYHLRQRVMPGITGWAQINQAYDTCVDDVRHKVNYDLEYLQRRSVRLDLKIMARTVPVMAFSNFGW